MRLEKIRLAGFKSFVDATTVQFNSSLVGVVGPNGCGKSNIIDAVRWVMGESSAKMLRGESMADVIFNGSTSRKPVGSASIELLFDNSDGTAGGQYAEYTQISVKRQVSRDGQSIYWLNNVRCRRRDIADLFLGTGLGPRSYAIIEQGMISRIIEARPEELRNYLEEAAGISKYKERRRETERRIEHTRENLERLSDLREEVQKQLRHLERQAATAEKYKALKEEERRVQAELLVLRLTDFETELDQRERAIAEQENLHQAALAQQRQLESEIERARADHAEANDGFNAVQGRFYAVGADIARLEEAIQYSKEARTQQESELRRIELALSEARSHRSKDEGELESLSAELNEGQPRLVAAQEQEQVCAAALGEVEREMQQWQQEWDAFSERAAEPAQQAQLERARLTHLERQETESTQRLERLEREHAELQDLALEAEIRTLEGRERDIRAQLEAHTTKVASSAEGIASLREQIISVDATLTDRRTRLEQAKGRLSSLDTLQQAASGEDQPTLESWLTDVGLDKSELVIEAVRVDPEWRDAVEAVLGDRLQARCVEDPGSYIDELARCESSLELVAAGRSPDSDGVPGTLGAMVNGPAALINALNRIRVTPDLSTALSLRSELDATESIVTRDGIWLGRDWVRWHGGSDAAGGALAREDERRALRAEVEEIAAETVALGAELQQSRDRLAELEHARAEAQSAVDAAARAHTDVSSRLSAKQAQAEQISRRMSGLTHELEDIRGRISTGRDEMAEARQKLHQHLADSEALGRRREELVGVRDQLRSRMEEARGVLGTARDETHRLELRIESLRSRENSLRGGIDRVAQQLTQAQNRHDELTRELAAAADPLQEQVQSLEQQLALRVAVEAELAAARRTLEEIDQRLRAQEQRRQEVEAEVQAERVKVDEGRMARQEVLVRAKTIEEQLATTDFASDELRTGLDADADAATWQERVERLAARIQRLGPINLAAIDEFREQSERMTYLDQQYKDINESLETLETAIRKIDKETRTRFKETFDKVDAGLKEIFPKLFGGGHAYLELTGEDLLDTGVAVMARPPGKRNASIHLLSGGEKALAAVALVFSIFELNPAPFCMLDEVDAPLDDANVDRYSALVKEMSERVQFIFISHNKVTMEIANNLIGVTMHEPGVSRLVSVDVDAAVAMAAS